MLQPFFAALHATPWSQWVRGSTWGYPALECVHLLGISLLLGPLAIVDLRLLLRPRQAATLAQATATAPWSVGGFLIALASGAAMFASRAPDIGANPAFAAKLLLLALAGANAALFHRRLGAGRIGGFGRMQAGVSLLLWVGVLVAGRLIAYV